MDKIFESIKQYPSTSIAILGGILMGIGIMGITGSFWAGILSLGILAIIGTGIYGMAKYG